ncbi:unnamed protein product [Sphagnum tenellum]
MAAAEAEATEAGEAGVAGDNSDIANRQTRSMARAKSLEEEEERKGRPGDEDAKGRTLGAQGCQGSGCQTDAICRLSYLGPLNLEGVLT